MATMLRVAGDQMLRDVGQIGSLPPITAAEASQHVRGETNETPIYSMLLHLAVADPTVAHQIRPLASQILLAYATLIYDDGGRRIALCTEHRAGKPPVPSAPEACRLARQLAAGKHPEILAHLPCEQTHLSDAFAHLEAVLPGGTAPKYVTQARAVRVMIYDAKERSSRRNRRSSQRRATTPPDLEGAGEAGLREHQRRQPAVEGTRVLSIGPLSRDQSHEYQRIGLTTAEVRAKRVTMRSSIMRGEHPGDSLSMRTRRQQGMVRDRARANQRLPIHRGLPRPDEVRALLADLRPWLQGTAPACQAIDAEAAGLLALMLATGGTLDELHGLPVVQEESAIPDGQSRAILTRGGINLWVRVPAPEMNPALYSAVSDLLEPIQTGLLLPLSEPILTLLRSVRKAAGTLRTSSMFTSDPKNLREAATKRLRKINERHHSQLRLARIPSVLPQVIADQCGNWSYAWILSGDGDPHAHTPLVYQTTPKSRLVSAYRDAIDHIFGTSGDDDEADPASATSDECYFGSALRPRPGVWEGIARELRQLIPEIPSALASSEEHARHHNAYTLYTALLVLVGTGLRAIRDPIESVLDIDWHNGLLFVVDKEARANGNERLIPLAPTVLEQLQAYRRHLLALASRWDHRRPDPAAELRAAANGNDNSTPFLLFLSEDMSASHVRPGTLSARLRNLLPAPGNIGRHHIRTHLTEMGCPGEWIDALLGHEPIGMEGYGPYSAMSINDLRGAATDWIEPMLQRHGWIPVEGVPA
ncbi:site-specific integrase [Thioalkalivibrio sp. AKL10]|uniref:site-specific integrase n=1 Tax=Thioalkalivibrio sp. AKL10 TaxID=1158158 RepID=UPI00037BC9D7|nr:site-specific integrase [Thioalkalivibrio sp. AKL10]